MFGDNVYCIIIIYSSILYVCGVLIYLVRGRVVATNTPGIRVGSSLKDFDPNYAV